MSRGPRVGPQVSGPPLRQSQHNGFDAVQATVLDLGAGGLLPVHIFCSTFPSAKLLKMHTMTGLRRRIRSRGRPHHLRRPWCIPPAVMREPGESIEAEQVLGEHPEGLALLLWSSVRAVTLWASADAERRPGLFSPQAVTHRTERLHEASPGIDLELPLTIITAVVAQPVEAQPSSVSLACLEVARWCERVKAFGSAVAFAQAAALADPAEPVPAYEVGRMTLAWGRLPRAETWFRRAIGLARRAKDWTTYASAYLGLAALYSRRGMAPQAHVYYRLASRTSRRAGKLSLRGAALHGMLQLAVDAGELDDAERYAKAAMRAYRRGHPRAPELLQDTARLWMAQGRYARAVPLLQKLLSTGPEPTSRAVIFGLLARAAAGTGDRRLYEEAWSNAWLIITHSGSDRDAPSRSLLELGRAASTLQDWIRMDQVVRLFAARPSPADARISEQLSGLVAESRRAG